MFQTRDKPQAGPSTLSGPSTPPGYTKYYLNQTPEDIGLFSPKSILMVFQDPDDTDDLVIVPDPNPTPSLYYSPSTKRRRTFFYGFLTTLTLLLVSFLLYSVYTSSESEPRNLHFRGYHPLLVFDSLLKKLWTHQIIQAPPPDSVSSVPTPAKRRGLPQCIIIGARKCGTRALIDMLNLHPQVEKAALEVHFFDRDENYGQGLEWYRSQMPETRQDQLCLEKSPSYFVTPEVPERIHGMNSSIKLLLIVREPVTRVISDYTQIYGTNSSKLHNGSKSTPPHLHDLVFNPDGSINVQYKAVRISMYARYLQRWLDVFPLSQLHIIDGDALIRDPYPVLKDVERFLSLEPKLSRDNFYFNVTKGFYCWRRLDNLTSSSASSSPSQVPSNPVPSSSLHCLNDSKGRRHPQVHTKVVSKLRKFYNPHNLRFYEMVSRDFGWPEQ